jgi:hypothetical protein
MSDCIFKAKIRVTPSSHEFWPAGGWHVRRNGWARFYACRDKQIVRRAIVEETRAGWMYVVSEITCFGSIAIAIQPASFNASEPTQCLHAADLAACAHRYMEVANV